MPINGVTRDSTVDSGQKYEVGFEERNLQVCNLQDQNLRRQPPCLERKPRPRGVDAGIDPPNASGISKTRFPENAVHSLRKSGHDNGIFMDAHGQVDAHHRLTDSSGQRAAKVTT
ncbi:hypothetical protein E4U50_002202 [Claviceps purpurea]|nr:hypothetical protein E4U50_002202 [Claviceps purpurea]